MCLVRSQPYFMQTFALPGSIVSPQQLSIWNIVHEAQSTALNAARNGTITAAVDRAAREVIEGYGYGEYFTHRLGHGISPPCATCNYA